MTEQRRDEILRFEEKHVELDTEKFFELAAKRGIRPEDFVEAEEQKAAA